MYLLIVKDGRFLVLEKLRDIILLDLSLGLIGLMRLNAFERLRAFFCLENASLAAGEIAGRIRAPNSILGSSKS